jgi:hypothetical protein
MRLCVVELVLRCKVKRKKKKIKEKERKRQEKVKIEEKISDFYYFCIRKQLFARKR